MTAWLGKSNLFPSEPIVDMAVTLGIWWNLLSSVQDARQSLCDLCTVRLFPVNTSKYLDLDSGESRVTLS